MRLIPRYNITLLIISLSGLLVIGFLFFKTMSYYLDRQLDETLVEEMMEVQGSPFNYKDLIIEFKKTDRVNGVRTFSDTIFYNPRKKLQERARYLSTSIKMNGEPFRVLIIASKADRVEEIKMICLVIILPVLLLLIILYYVNRFMINRLWHPFRKLLVNIKNFNVNSEHPFEPVISPVLEFRELNDAVLEMSLKVKSDYREIKLFTENASHEMMTPLAVINSKLDTILQSDSLGKEESETLNDLYKATSQLTKLNQSLLLLIKIDHNLLQDNEKINIAQLIEEKTEYFQELIAKRNLTIRTNLDLNTVLTNRNLLEILINNLFSNAIRHNYYGGTIEISLTPDSLIFSNTSKNPKLDSERVFERFYKDTNSEGTGLGLSILKQICNRQHYDLKYSYNQEQHSFTITFQKP